MWRECSVCKGYVETSEGRAVAAVCDVAVCKGKELIPPADLVPGACAGAPTPELIEALEELRKWDEYIRERAQAGAYTPTKPVTEPNPKKRK